MPLFRRPLSPTSLSTHSKNLVQLNPPQEGRRFDILMDTELVLPGCYFDDWPDQLEYLVAAPAIWNEFVVGDRQAIPDKVFLGVPPTSLWTPVQVTPPATNVYWRRLASDRNQNMVALGGRVITGPFGTYQLRDIAVSSDGGQTWTHLVAEGDGTIVSPDWFAHVVALDHGGFAVTTTSAFGAIGIIPADLSGITMVTPGGYANTTQQFFDFRAINSISTKTLLAITQSNYTGDNAAMFCMSRSDDYGQTWTDWELKGEPVTFPDFSLWTAGPKGLFCLGDKLILIGWVVLTSSDFFETWDIIQTGTHQFNSYFGGRYDNMDQENGGAPLDWDSGDGFSYFDYGPYYHELTNAVKVAPNVLLAYDIFFESHRFTDERWDWIGYQDAISWGYPTDMVFSRHHGVIMTTTGEQTAMTQDGAHWMQFSHWDNNVGPPLELRHIQNFAVAGTTNQTFYDSLLGYRSGF